MVLTVVFLIILAILFVQIYSYAIWKRKKEQKHTMDKASERKTLS